MKNLFKREEKNTTLFLLYDKNNMIQTRLFIEVGSRFDHVRTFKEVHLGFLPNGEIELVYGDKVLTQFDMEYGIFQEQLLVRPNEKYIEIKAKKDDALRSCLPSNLNISQKDTVVYTTDTQECEILEKLGINQLYIKVGEKTALAEYIGNVYNYPNEYVTEIYGAFKVLSYVDFEEKKSA